MKRARIITMAWGRPYVETLRSVALPAALAPGNLPSLAAVLDCELVIVTERGFFDELLASPVVRRLQEHCPVKLIMMDDLVVSAGRYGMALSFALHRGLADLGEAMTDQYFIFFNADFILADGSLRAVGHRVLAGEQLIHAPSYCVIRERTELLLRQRVDPAAQSLVIPHREMAELILANRHYTIRGKTVNQRVFHSAYIEQFYWQVDDHTLLGRQMPIALVCMKPERFVQEMRTFWDYGVVSEFCPNAKPCVLGDSDDFCMLELRHEATMLEQMALGWPTPEEIAHTLGRFVTEDQRKLGRYPLVLHSRDVPKGAEADQQYLTQFVDRVYGAMPERAMPHLNHPFWLDHYEPFLAEQAKYRAAQTARIASPSSDEAAAAAPPPLSRPSATRALVRRHLRKILGELKARLVGSIPFVRPLHPYYAVLTPTYELLERDLAAGAHRILVVSDHDGPLTRFARGLSRRGHSVYEAPAVFQVDTPAAELNLQEVLRRGPFDILISEVTFSGLLKFSMLFRAVQPAMVRPARVLVFHFNPALTAAHLMTRDVITQATVPIGRSEIFFMDSQWTRRALSLLQKGVRARQWRGLGMVAFIGFAGASLLSAALASRRPPKLTTRAVPKACLSMTIRYELPASPGESTGVDPRRRMIA